MIIPLQGTVQSFTFTINESQFGSLVADGGTEIFAVNPPNSFISDVVTESADDGSALDAYLSLFTETLHQPVNGVVHDDFHFAIDEAFYGSHAPVTITYTIALDAFTIDGNGGIVDQGGLLYTVTLVLNAPNPQIASLTI